MILKRTYKGYTQTAEALKMPRGQLFARRGDSSGKHAEGGRRQRSGSFPLDLVLPASG